LDHGGQPKLLRELNGKVLLNILREQGPLSRPALSKLSGLSLPTVTARVRTLLEMGYVNELGQTKSRGGRPAQLLEFNREFGYVLGIDVGDYRVSVVLANLAGELVAFERHRLGAHVDGEHVLEAVSEVFQQVLAQQDLELSVLMAAGLSTPGIVNPRTGVVSLVPNIPGWAELEPAKFLEQLIGKPVVIENNVNAAVEGEQWRGVARDAQDVVFVDIGKGIGAGVLIEGKLYRGLGGAAGEIGLQRAFHEDEPLDELFGPLERECSGLGMTKRYRELTGADGLVAARDLFEKAHAGDKLAQRVVDESVSMFAGGLVNMCTALAPELVVLGGEVASAGEALVEPVRRRLERALPFPPRVAVSSLEGRASVMGAIRMALRLALWEGLALDTRATSQPRDSRSVG
jgi:predicted NBD/HSP70 family sugar kinase